MITSYTGLKSAIATWMNREDLTDQIPYFINFAEMKLNRDLALHQWAQRATTDTVSGEAYIERPYGSGGIITLRLNSDPITPMEFVTNEYMDTVDINTTGKPTMYGFQGNEIRLAPTPDSVYEIEISYFKKPSHLSDSNTTNWYIENSPDLLLAACMVRATRYVRDRENMLVWQAEYEDLITEIKEQDRLLLYPDGEVLQMRSI